MHMASFCRGQRDRTIGFVSSRTPRDECWVRFAKLDAEDRPEPSPKKLGSFCQNTCGLPKWLRFVEQCRSGVGFVLSNTDPAPNWVRFVKCSFRLRAGFVLQNPAPGAPPWLRLPYHS